MTDVGIGLGYWHPRTEFLLHVVKRTVVTTVGGASHLSKVIDVDVRPGVVPDLGARQQVFFDVGRLEKLDLEFSLDDRGLLEGLNSESGRDISPVLSLVGKVVGLTAVVLAGFAVRAPRADSLEDMWAAGHKRFAELLPALETQADALLSAMVEPQRSAAEIAELGRALEVVNGYLSSISQLKREWIAAQAGIAEEREWKLSPADLLLVHGAELPGKLEKVDIPVAQDGSGEMGVLVAVCDPQRSDAASADGATGTSKVDVILLRGSRPAQVGVFLEAPDGTWTLQPDSVTNLDLVDEFSPDLALSVDGSWMRTKTFRLAYHPDKSLKTFGLASTSSASSIATGIGGVVDAASASAKSWSETPSAQARELDRLKTQLDLAKTASEIESLAATRSRSTEVAVLEQEKKIRDART